MRRRWLRLLAVLTSLMLVAAACNGDDDDGDGTETGTGTEPGTEETQPDDTEEVEEGADRGNVDGEFVVATVLPLSGDLAAFGPGMQAAVELAVEETNEAGGVLSDARILTFDSATDPVESGNATQEAIRQGADLVIGAAGSAPTLLGTLPALGRNTSVMGCSGSATSPALSTDDYSDWMRTVPSDIGQAQLMASKLAEAGHQSVVVMFRADEYGEAFADNVIAELEAAGIEVSERISVDADAQNFDAEVQQALDAGADATVMILFPEEGAPIISGLLEGGADISTLYGGDGLADATLASSVDPDNANVLDGMFGTRPGGDPEAGEAGATPFIERLREAKGVEETTFAETTKFCFEIAALAAHQADTDDAREYRDAIPDVLEGGTDCATYADCKALLDEGEDIAFTGPGITFNANLEPNEGDYQFWTFAEGGTIEVVEFQTIPIPA